MKTNIEILREMFVQMAYEIQEMCDDYADKNNIPTKTIDDYIDGNDDN